jgi:hypothetical protein
MFILGMMASAILVVGILTMKRGAKIVCLVVAVFLVAPYFHRHLPTRWWIKSNTSQLGRSTDAAKAIIFAVVAWAATRGSAEFLLHNIAWRLGKVFFASNHEKML